MAAIESSLAAFNMKPTMRTWIFITGALTICCSFGWSHSHENALNVPQILLPYTPINAVPANYTLKALRGCLKWTSSKPGVAKVFPIHEKDSSIADRLHSQTDGEGGNDACSRSAMVVATSGSREKETTVITAEDESTGILLRCDVFVDTIHRIEIATTTRELLLGEAPEVFDVYGYDEEGNLFSSLGSTVFEWYLSPSNTNDTVDPTTVLRFLQFQGSSYETEPEINMLEEKGFQGSSVIMEGINTGEALVSAKLTHAAYKHVAPSTVKLMVVDNIILHPSADMYILVGTKVVYEVKQLRRGHAKEIVMPSSQYRFQLDKEGIAQLNHEESSVTGLSLGTVKVILIDNNVAHTKSIRQPSATVHVVHPESLGFAISPGNSWVLQTFKEYTIKVEIFDTEKHKIQITDNTILFSAFQEQYFDIKFRSSNNSYHHTKALKVGKTIINATLLGVQAESGTTINLKKPIYGEKIIEIFDEIKVEPNVVIFPWDAGKENVYTVQLKASGGSGAYQWTSQNYSMATVSNKGLAKVEGILGASVIKATDKRNSLHFGKAKIVVLPPEEMHFLATEVEAEIGKVLELPLSVSAFVDVDGKRILKIFEDCRQLSLTRSLSNEGIFSFEGTAAESSNSHKDSCMVIKLKALKSGFTSLSISHKGNGVVIKASITIAAYSPLMVLHPKDVASVTLGSSEIVVLAGGPLPWILDSSGFYEYLSAEEEEYVAIQPMDHINSLTFNQKRDDVHYFRVTCKQSTEMQLLSGQVGNKPTAKNQFPASAITKLRFLCTPPGSLSLQPSIVLPSIDGHQMTLESCKDANKMYPVRNKRDLMILLIVRDHNGQTFANASSLDIVWTSSDNTLAKISQRAPSNYKIKSNSTASAAQMIVLSDKTGPVIIEAKVSGYRQVALYAIGIYDKDSKPKISPPVTGNLGLLLVNERTIVPHSLVIFGHPQNKARLRMIDGSQHYRVKANDEDYADIRKLKSELLVTPRATGTLILSVHDICLDSEEPAKAHMTFADIFSIHVVVADKVGLHKTIKAIVQIKDVEGKFLSFSQMKLLSLTAKFSNDLIKIQVDDQKFQSEFTDKAVFILEGTAVGIASLTFHAVKASKAKISSRPKDIQVFPPLELEPKHIVLIAGATFQVHSSGGPRPESTTVFEMHNASVATVSSTGIVHALTPGNTTLVGMALGSDANTGKPIIYSRAIVTVEVIRLTGFKIHLSTRILISGSQVGMYAVGLSDQGPFSFATSHPFIKFSWSSGNNDIAVLKSVYDMTGITVDNEKDFRVTLNTLKAGETTIKLAVELPAAFAELIAIPDAVLEDEIQVQVFEGLKVLFPSNGRLLLPPNSEAKIETSRNGISRLSYEVVGGCPSTKTAAAIVDVSSEGVIRTTSASGAALVRIISHEDFGLNQTAIINVEVRTVASITLKSLSSVIATKEKTHSFPIGYAANFAVTLHDNIGRKFDALSTQLKHRVQRNDVMNVIPDFAKGIYTTKAVKTGSAILKVWDDQSGDVADYVRIRVTYGIQPSNGIFNHGDIVCFKPSSNSPQDKENVIDFFQGSKITWSSSNPDVFEINAKSGISFAKLPGAATIYASHGDFVTHVEVKSHKASSIELSPGNVDLISNIKAKAFDIKVDIKGALPSSPNLCTNTMFKSSKGPFSCSLLSQEADSSVISDMLFSVSSKYVNGVSFCEIIPNELSRRDMKKISLLETKFSLQASLQGDDRISNSIELRFLPSFYITKTDIELTSSKSQDIITIFGVKSQLNSLKVHSDDPSVVRISLVDSKLSESSLDYEISLVKAAELSLDSLHIVFESKITGQKEDVIISIRLDRKVEQLQCTPSPESTAESDVSPGDKSKIFGDHWSWMVLYTVIIATFILIICAYHVLITRRDYNRLSSPMPAFHSAAPPPYQIYPGQGSPLQTWTPTHRHESPHSPPSERRPHTVYKDPLKTTPGNRTLFSVGQ